MRARGRSHTVRLLVRLTDASSYFCRCQRRAVVVVVVAVSSIPSSVSYVIICSDSLFPKLYVIIISLISRPPSTSYVANITVPVLLWEMMPSLTHWPCRSSNICSPDGVTIVLELLTRYPLSLSRTTSISSCHSYCGPCLSVFVVSIFCFFYFGHTRSTLFISYLCTSPLLLRNTPPLSPHPPSS